MKELSASAKALMVIATVMAIAALYFGRSVFIPLALALVLSFLLTPFVSLLEKLRLGRVVSVIIVLAISFGLVGVITYSVAGQLIQIVEQLPDYKENLDAKIRSLHRSNATGLGKATASVQELNKELTAVPGQVSGQVQAKSQGTAHPIKPIPVQMAPPATSLVQDFSALLGPLAGPVETASIVVIFTLFMLMEREDLRNRAIRLAGRGKLSLMTQAFDDAGRRLSRFLLLQFLVNTGYGSLFGLGLYVVGVPHAFLWGLVAALFRFVPYIGTFIAAALPIAMAIAVFPGWHQAGVAFGIFLVLELAVSNLVEPLLYGSHTGISSLAILVAAIFWATLWGPVGLILSTPLTVCLVVLGRHVPQLKFLEVMLGDEPALTPEEHFYQRILAADPEEARKVADAYLKENPIESLYQALVIPALKLAEHDFQIDALDEDGRRYMLRTTRALVEDLGVDVEEASAKSKDRDSELAQGVDSGAFATTITCLPARSGPDELIGVMLVQVLKHAGFSARQVRAREVEAALTSLSSHDNGIVCVSCLPPVTAQIRTLCKRLEVIYPGSHIILGFWDFAGGAEKAREKVGKGCVGTVVTTLAEAIQEVRRSAEASVESERFAEQKNLG